jgi:hypothetical protein
MSIVIVARVDCVSIGGTEDEDETLNFLGDATDPRTPT